MSGCEALRLLTAGGFDGKPSVEFRHEHFNGTEAGEGEGLCLSLEFLRRA